MLHLVVRVLAVVAWLIFGPRDRITGRTVLLALIWPTLWLTATIAAGAMTGWCPYPFLNVADQGPVRVAAASGGIAVLLGVLGTAFWLVDRRLTRRTPDFVSSRE